MLGYFVLRSFGAQRGAGSKEQPGTGGMRRDVCGSVGWVLGVFVDGVCLAFQGASGMFAKWCPGGIIGGHLAVFTS